MNVTLVGPTPGRKERNYTTSVPGVDKREWEILGSGNREEDGLGWDESL